MTDQSPPAHEPAPNFTDNALDNLRREYEATKNPLWAWEAIRTCEGGFYGERRPMPSWCTEYLVRCAERVAALWDGRDFRSTADPKKLLHTEAVALVPEAMGFMRKGFNAFKSGDGDVTRRRAAVFHDKVLVPAKLDRPSRLQALREEFPQLSQDDRALDRALQKGRVALGLKASKPKPKP